MQYRNLGATGLAVSRLCLGTATFGLQCDEATSHAILDAADEGGIDFLDTADVYPMFGGRTDHVGLTEEILGRWLRGKRERFILATKCVSKMGPKPWNQGMSRKHVLEAIEASLRRLQTDHVDLFQLHLYDETTPLDEALEALDALVRSGKTRYVGVSNWPAYRVARALGRCELKDLAKIASVQPRYNLLFRAFERDLFPLCMEEGIGVIPFNPLGGGLLTGKHDRHAGPREGTRYAFGNWAAVYNSRYWHERELDTVDALRPIAKEAGTSMATMAAQWVLANPAITSVIIGASRPEQLADSFAAAATPIDPALKTKLDEVTAEWRRSDATR